MANNAMGMFFMLILVGGAIVAYVKRDEIAKMFGGGGGGFKFRQDNPALDFQTRSHLNQDVYARPDLSVKFLDNTGKPGAELNQDESVGKGLFGPTTTSKSKFARISYF